MLHLLIFQEIPENSMELIRSCSTKIKEILKGIQQQGKGMNSDMLKTAYLFLESLFHLNTDNFSQIVYADSMQGFYTIITQLSESLNQDIMTLNMSVKQEPLSLSPENTLVLIVIEKVGLINGFLKMLYKILESLTKNQREGVTFYKFLKDPKLSMILIRVFGILVQVPNSLNNENLIMITGVNTLDDNVNQLKTQSLECINFMLKRKNKATEQLIHKNEHQTFNGLTHLIPILISSLVIFSQRSDLE